MGIALGYEDVIVLGDFNDYDGAGDALDHVNSAPITNVLLVLLALIRLDLADPGDDLVNTAVFVPKGAEHHRCADRGDAIAQLGHELAQAIVVGALPGGGRRVERAVAVEVVNAERTFLKSAEVNFPT